MAGGYSIDGPIDPIHGIDPKRPVEDHNRPPQGELEHVRRLSGRIVAVHQKSGQHEEGHILDATVGAEAHNEIIIRVPQGDLNHLVGRRVTIRIEAED